MSLLDYKQDAKDPAFFSYTDKRGQKCWGFRREYKRKNLHKRGFATKAEAQAKLLALMHEINNPLPSNAKPAITTLQSLYNAYKDELESQASLKAAGASGVAYRHGVNAILNILETFVSRVGPNKEVREVRDIDLREWYLWLQESKSDPKEPEVSQASAASHLGRLGGMLKYGHENFLDLATWNRPRLKKIKAKLKNPGRIVTDEEYTALVRALAAPPSCKRIADRRALWREAADAVQLLRNTGARLNEALRVKLDQVDLVNETITLYATKTEQERTNPLSPSMVALIKARKQEGLCSDYLFARASKTHFDGDVESACRDAAKEARLKFGRKTPGGFTLHGLRHTFITDLLDRGVPIPTVMKLSGHKSLESFSVYLHDTEFGKLKAKQVIANIDSCLESGGIVAGFEAENGEIRGIESNTPIAVNC